MNVRRPECDEHPSRPIARYALANQTTMLCGVIGPPRSDTITGPADWVAARHAAKAVRKSSCNGMTRPLPFLAAWSGNSRTVPMAPVGSVTMAQVRWAISPARNPALADSRTMTLLRNGWRLVSANSRRSSRLSSDRIFACFPRIAITLQNKQTKSYSKTDLDQTKYELAMKLRFIASLRNSFRTMATRLRIWGSGVRISSGAPIKSKT